MRPHAIRPRPDQVEELTRGLQLPLTEIANDHLQVIAEGLRRAFNDIRSQMPRIVTRGTEAEMTAHMETRLNRLLDQDPLLGQLVTNVARGKETISFNGAHLEKRPDLSIYLSNGFRGFPLVAEAKILDAPTSKTEALYCSHGLSRFIDGEYAWGTREAFMLAYVRDGTSIETTLRPFLFAAKSQTPPGYMVEELPTPVVAGISDLARSRHGRKFTYINQAQSSGTPGSISIWHLWLSCGTG